MEFITKRSIKFTLGILISGFLSYSQNIYTAAGTGTQGFSGDASFAIAAQLNGPVGVCSDAIGNIYIADWNNHRVRKINTSGIISTFAGTGNPGYSGDGGAAISADIREPRGVACDASGNVYIVGNFLVRKVNSFGIISTFAGTGVTGFAGDGGLATNANLGSPEYICFDMSGNAYISDFNNNRIRKVNTSGIISNYAGTGTFGYSGDGGLAVNANLSAPVGLVVNAQGDLLIADYANNCIRKVDGSGIISTIIGTGSLGFSGDGGNAINAQLASPCGITLDGSGNIYFSDYGNNRIRKVSTSGIITTIAGNGTAGVSGDGALAANASLNGPSGIALDGVGNIYFSDGFNHKVREVCIGDCLAGIKNNDSEHNSLGLYPNPNNGKFQLTYCESLKDGKVEIADAIGQIVYEDAVSYETACIISTKLKPGFYSCIVHQKKTYRPIILKFIVTN